MSARRHRPVLASLVTACLLVSTGCPSRKPDKDPKAGASGGSGAADPSTGLSQTMLGFVVARSFTILRAPQNVFKIAGWNSTSSWTKLVELAPEGKAVKKGAVVARFAFEHKRALFWIQDRIRRAKATAAASAITEDKTLNDLLAERSTRILAANTALLDTHRAAAISRRQLELYRITHRMAVFEVEAIEARIKAQRRARAAVKAYHAQNVAREKTLLGRYEGYKARYELIAPHDGVVRHGYRGHHRRKVKKGDGMPAGTPCIYLGRDDRLAVRFFVLEHLIGRVRIGQEVTVLSARSDSGITSKIVEIERFPQELGFLREMPDLPEAREKAFVVVAELPRDTKLSAGHEVRVRLSARAKLAVRP